jgi:uncharacterized membrane protein
MEALFCPFCGAALTPYLPRPQALRINTHSYGWAILSFLLSFLWFKINNNPLFPLGFIGALVITYWSYDIDKSLGKQTVAIVAFALSVIGMILGLTIR